MNTIWHRPFVNKPCCGLQCWLTPMPICALNVSLVKMATSVGSTLKSISGAKMSVVSVSASLVLTDMAACAITSHDSFLTHKATTVFVVDNFSRVPFSFVSLSPSRPDSLKVSHPLQRGPAASPLQLVFRRDLVLSPVSSSVRRC